MKITFGIDNAILSHSVSIIDETRKIINSFEIENTLAGFKVLGNSLIKYPGASIGFEISQGPLVDYLRTLQLPLYSLNPLKVKRHKESFVVSGNKTDRIDAFAIADYVRSHEKDLRPMIFNSADIETLKYLNIAHERLTREHTRNTNRLLAIFRQYFPLYAGLFSNSAPKTLLNMVISYPIWSKLRDETSENIEKFLKQNKYYNSKYIQRILQKIDMYTHCVSPEVENAIQYEAVAIAELLLGLKSNLEKLRKEMVRITSTHPMGEVFKSLPGAGDILSAKLLGHFGDNKTRFNTAGEVGASFGTAPINYQSGGYHKVIIRKACNKRQRSVMYDFAFCSMRFSVWAKEYYKQQRKLGKRHSVAVRALSNKWVKVIFAMWKNHHCYDESKKICDAA